MRISAILLSLGESTLAEAESCLRQQRLAPEQIVRIESVRPFSRAFNQAVEQVEQEFFLQCDADMLLHPWCSARLLSEMTADTAVTVGLLDDPLQGRIRGVKLFRTSCCRALPLSPVTDCETAQTRAFQEQGWRVRLLPEVLGRHRLDTSDALYNFERFRLLGSKSRIRRNWWDLSYRLWQLGQRRHLPASHTAGAALLYGLMSPQAHLHLPPVASCGYLRWTEQARCPGPAARLLNQEAPWEQGWQDGESQSLATRAVVKQCLAQADPQSWLYLAGFLWQRLEQPTDFADSLRQMLREWQGYLRESYPKHRSGERFWEEREWVSSPSSFRPCQASSH